MFPTKERVCREDITLLALGGGAIPRGGWGDGTGGSSGWTKVICAGDTVLMLGLRNPEHDPVLNGPASPSAAEWTCPGGGRDPFLGQP